MRWVAWAGWLLSGAVDPSGSPSPGQGELELGPAAGQVVRVQDEVGDVIATVVVRSDRGVRIGLPAGRYRLVGAEEEIVGTAELDAGEREHVALPGEGDAASSGPANEGNAVPDRFEDATRSVARPSATALPRPSAWRPIVAPVLSAVVPGAGQAVNREGAKAIAVLVGVVGLGIGSVELWRADASREGLARGSDVTRAPIELVRLWGFAGMSTAFGLLYLGQIFDAHANARGRPAQPDPSSRVSLSFSRASTVGARAGQPSHALYDDWTLAALVRLHPRVVFGVADLGIAYAGHGAALLQGGLRAMARLTLRRRFELLAGGGAFLQVGSVPRSDRDPKGHVGGVVYAQLEGRWFLLDRWSLGLAPRVSLPLTDRWYVRGTKLPRLATTFELVASVGVQF